MAEPLFDGALAPREVELALRALAAHRLGELHESLGRVVAAVEEDILDVLEERFLDVGVRDELAGVHDAHIEAGLYRMEEEGRVHCLTHDVVAAEREREVRDAARDERAWAALLDQRGRLDERLRELVVLLDTRGNCEHVRVEDDVSRGEAGLSCEQPVGTLTDRDLPLDGVGLSLLVERHHDDSRAVAADLARLFQELLFTLFE